METSEVRGAGERSDGAQPRSSTARSLGDGGRRRGPCAYAGSGDLYALASSWCQASGQQRVINCAGQITRRGCYDCEMPVRDVGDAVVASTSKLKQFRQCRRCGLGGAKISLCVERLR